VSRQFLAAEEIKKISVVMICWSDDHEERHKRFFSSSAKQNKV